MLFTDLILVDQDCFANREGWELLLHLIPDADVVEKLREKWEKTSSSSEAKWKDLTDQIRKYDKDSTQRVC